MASSGISQTVYGLYKRCPKAAYFEFSTNTTCRNYSIEEAGFRANVKRFIEDRELVGDTIIEEDIVLKPDKSNFSGIIDLLLTKNGVTTAYLFKNSIELANDYDIYKMAWNLYVAKLSKMKIDEYCLISINNEFRKTDYISAKMFNVQYLYNRVSARLYTIQNEVENIQSLVKKERPPGRKLSWYCTKPTPCPFQNLCFGELPGESTVLNLTSVSESYKFTQIWKGVSDLADISPTEKFSKPQWDEIQMFVKKQEVLNKKKLKEFLLDTGPKTWILLMNTKKHLIPVFNGDRPMTDIPYYYRLTHIDNKSKLRSVFEGMSKDPLEPSNIEHLIRKFVDDIENSPNAKILVFDDQLINATLTRACRWFPDLKTRIERVKARIVDLKDIFDKKLYDSYKFMGSHNLDSVAKAILPARDHFEPLKSEILSSYFYRPINQEASNSVKVLSDKRCDAIVKIYSKLNSIAGL